jgi:small subunit ribosomal protein S7
VTPRPATRIALSIAGSDPSGGAGIQADLKTFHQLGVYGEAVVTLITVQNTTGVTRVEVMAPDLILEQIQAVCCDIQPHAAKIGALGNRAVVEAVATAAQNFAFPLVIDPVYNSTLVSQLVNKILGRGKRSVAEKIVYGALEGARDKTGTDPVVTLKRALDNVKPTIEVKSRRVGGATYQVPVEVKAGRSTTLALRWLVGYSRQRREKTMTERLMNELLDASNGLGASVKRREDTHKMAESNKAFAHYRW